MVNLFSESGVSLFLKFLSMESSRAHRASPYCPFSKASMLRSGALAGIFPVW